jgi:hypothetical protein
MIRAAYTIALTLVFINTFAQDSIVKYRSTAIQGSVSHFLLLGAKYPQLTQYFPSAVISVKSFGTDSIYNAKEKYHFTISAGAALSRFSLTDPSYYYNMLDKRPIIIRSQRYFGGFGINYRKSISRKLILDADLVPCVEIVWDKGEETRVDTALQETREYFDIYQGLHLFGHVKLEWKTYASYGFFFSLSGNLPVLNSLGKREDPYGDSFKGQIMAGVGLVYFHRSKGKFPRR